MLDAAQSNSQHTTYYLVHSDKLKFYMRKVVHAPQNSRIHSGGRANYETYRLVSQHEGSDNYLTRMKEACQMQFSSIETLIGKKINTLRGILYKEQLRMLVGSPYPTNDSSTSSQKPAISSHFHLDHLEPENVPLFESRSPFLRDDTYFPHSNLNQYEILRPDFDDFLTMGQHSELRYDYNNFLD